MIVSSNVVEEKLLQKPKSLVDALTILNTDLEIDQGYAFLIQEEGIHRGQNSVLMYAGTLNIKQMERPTAPYEYYLKKLISNLFKPFCRQAVIGVETKGFYIGGVTGFDIGLILRFERDKCKELENWHPSGNTPKEVKTLQYIVS